MVDSFEVYIHSPWCKRRCPYCDFTVYIDNTPPFARRKDQILRNWEWNREYFQGTVSTIYFGGGTPSLLPLSILSDIIQVINPEANEITIEINPGTIQIAQLEQYVSIGINRVSLGIQSFQPRFEKLLGRGGTVQQARALIQAVRALPFQSWSLDLMFGLPDQTLEELLADLEEIIRIRPPHISLYGLMYKPGTPFYHARNSGKLKEIDTDVWEQMFDTIVLMLHQEGYHRYEVSNFCLPTHEAQHNEAIWMGKPYMGLGPSAHGFLPDGRRSQYPKAWHAWLESIPPMLEISTAEQLTIDLILTKIRHSAGFSIKEIQERGFDLDTNTIEYLIKTETINYNDGNIRLSSKGWILVDFITRRLIQALIKSC